MPTKTWKLIDDSQDLCLESLEISGDEIGGAAAGSRVTLRTLRGGLREGVRLLEIDNGTLRVALLPDRGMSIWKMCHGDVEIGWPSPIRGPVHPRWVPVGESSGLGFLDGFDEMLVRCGLVSNGAPEFDESGRVRYPLHGRIGNLPAHHLSVAMDAGTGTIVVTGTVDETRFHFEKLRLSSSLILAPDAPYIMITDGVENLSGNPTEMQLLYHINFGAPIHGPGSQIVAAVKEIVPRNAHAAGEIDAWNEFGPAEVGSEERVFFFDLLADEQGVCETLLKGPDGSRGVSVKFNKSQLPHFTLWKNTPPLADGYVTGLEPGTNFPNPRSFEGRQGRVVKLESGQMAQFNLSIRVLPDAEKIAEVERSIRTLQESAEPLIHREPQPGWVAD
jgi:hypothetical protein